MDFIQGEIIKRSVVHTAKLPTAGKSLALISVLMYGSLAACAAIDSHSADSEHVPALKVEKQVQSCSQIL